MSCRERARVTQCPAEIEQTAQQADHIQFNQRGVSILHVISNPFPMVWHTIKVCSLACMAHILDRPVSSTPLPLQCLQIQTLSHKA